MAFDVRVTRSRSRWTFVKESYGVYMYCTMIKLSTALLEKQSKFPRYNMKYRGKRDTSWTILRSITFSLLHFKLYRGQSITFRTVCNVDSLCEVGWHYDRGKGIPYTVKRKGEGKGGGNLLWGGWVKKNHLPGGKNHTMTEKGRGEGG